MEDSQKTKEHIIDELATMRRYVDELKAKITMLEPKMKVDTALRSPRLELNAEIEFIADFDIVQAKGINISDGGICFEVEKELPFEMQFKLNDEQHRYRAHLIWVKHLPDGGCRIGLRFVPPEPFPQF